jgi:hypothetical protein
MRPGAARGRLRPGPSTPRHRAILTFSGADGSQIYESELVPGVDRHLAAHCLVALDDLNMDGCVDYCVTSYSDGGRGCVTVLSGRTGKVLNTITGDEGQGFGSALAGPFDLNGDGSTEVAVRMQDAELGRGGVLFFTALSGTRVSSIPANDDDYLLGASALVVANQRTGQVAAIAVGSRPWSMYEPGLVRVYAVPGLHVSYELKQLAAPTK